MRKRSKKITAMLLVAAMCISSLTACGKKTESDPVSNDPTATPTTTASDNKQDPTPTVVVEADSFSEAPMLTDQVAAGTLPKVEDRIPTKDDVMVETVASVGTYGGSFELALTSAGWSTGKPIEQGLFRFTNDGSVEPNVAKGYDVNEDATVYTIYLREGMRWSDGEPFTAEDCVFFYDHMCVPETFGKKLWDCFKVDNPETGETTTCKFAKVDDYTFTVTFEFSKPSFIENLAINAKWCFAPAHYHKTILPEFIGEEAALAKATEMGFSDVAAMGKQTGYYFWNVPGVPTLNSYVLSTEAGKSDVNGDYYEFVRNPYYWKVDQVGNQLPYIDKIEYTKIADADQSLLKLLAGELTYTDVSFTQIETVQENADKVGYHINLWSNGLWADTASQLELNQTVADEDLRALFQAKEFREALSICVDREEYSQLISDGWCAPIQCSPAKGTLGSSDEWASKWTTYDVAKAKSLLEGLGLVMGSDGYYDFANGKDFCLNISAFTEMGTDEEYVVLKKYFDEAGIKTTYQPIDRDLLNNRITSNEYDAVLGPIAPAETVSIILRPDTLVPVRNYAEWYGQVGTWYESKGANGIEPTGDLLKLCNLYDELKAAIGAEEKNKVALDMLKLHEDNIWVLGYMGPQSTIMVVDNDLVNFPDEAVFSDEFRGVGIAHIDCCYFAK